MTPSDEFPKHKLSVIDIGKIDRLNGRIWQHDILFIDTSELPIENALHRFDALADSPLVDSPLFRDFPLSRILQQKFEKLRLIRIKQ